MGQTSSRNRRQEPRRSVTFPSAPESQQTQQDDVLDRADTLPIRTDEEPSSSIAANKRSRRVSMPKRLLDALHSKPSGTSRNRTASTVSAATVQSQSSRRRWRLSRRWSKAPEDLALHDASPDVVPTVEEDAEETRTNVDDPQPSGSAPSGKGKMRESQDQDNHAADNVEESSDLPSAIVTTPPSTSGDPNETASGTSIAPIDSSENIVRSDSQEASLAARTASLRRRFTYVSPFEADDDEVVIQPTMESQRPTSSIDNNAQLPHTSPSPPAAPPTQAPGRQFPPPGTLVVVQGVVHTTDVTRPSEGNATTQSESVPPSRRRASSTPRPSTPAEERNSVRNRLSAFVPRPSSMLSTLSSSPATDSTSQPLNMVNTELSDSSSNTELGQTNESSTRNTTPPVDNTTSTGPSNTDLTSNSLSPSSIDVLGTLLSVAAAATAASLLTGSSEPIFSSGLAPPAARPTPNFAVPGVFNNGDRPLSPTPTAGLGVGSVGFSGLGTPDATTGNPRDRMRQVWSSLRDRLGLRGPGIPGTRVEETDPAVRTRPDGTPMDAREIMLAEMARAFNLGLGLNNPPQAVSGDSATNPTAASTSPQEARPSNLQVNNETTPPSLPPPDSFERFLIDLQADLRIALTQEAPPTGPSADSSAQSAAALPQVNIVPSHAADLEVASIASGAYDTAVEDMDDDEPPPLADISDSEDEDAEDEDEDADMDLPPLADRTPRATHDGDLGSIPVPAFTAGSTSRTEHRPGGGINWWRMYRFPAITSPQGPGPQNGAPANTPSAMNASVPTMSGISTETAPSDQRPNIVVPVIVVGLQSVNTGQHAHGHGQAGENRDFGEPNESDPMDFDGWNPGENPSDTPQNPQDRRWHARATNALRNLRRARRPARQATADSPGSRTFMIYVIGGYYPPDHQIITAGDLDSFEALWDLAELLGQVKPPTASKEEIDRSGLEVIKPSSLQQYEQEKKISSNCVDKCLICLDDYMPEEDIRVLGCKHGFHKTCVDRWLETGRNNCPACRSKGVGNDNLGAGSDLPTAFPS
ncbi:hypothetical protein BJ138DRAFT_1109648 [Hygrophoropsis aurantiaca]|uniref:Uncharacterized protein n=1 Tax=Hygrophoropsis aurantiaca TaxID=72124 RepID=A0ACB8ARN2_9AGAM|nr:hypothetical protein BJ138DRAFT_1109648 [Hygrophoropsis aurantiaca]